MANRWANMERGPQGRKLNGVGSCGVYGNSDSDRA